MVDRVSMDVLIPRLLWTLVAVDLSLVAVNAFGAPSFLNLDEERNFPTWYSSAKLLLTALAALACARVEDDSRRVGIGRWTWPAVAALFVGLSLDETSTAHERLASAMMSGSLGESVRSRLLGGDATKDAFAWPVLFAPLILATVYFLAVALYAKMKGNRRSLWLGLGGVAAFLGGVVLEGPAVYSSPPLDAWGAGEIARYSLFVLFEETAELAGATLMLASLLLHLKKRD